MALHPRRIPLELATAHHIESWVRAAIRLRVNYTTKPKAELQRICLANNLRVTWSKLVRTRWCLVAASALSESRLSVWDISSGSWTLRGEWFLDGPVIDGHLEDIGKSVTVALTIGTVYVIDISLEEQKSKRCLSEHLMCIYFGSVPRQAVSILML